MTRPVIAIMAGGTGGHVFPALALAQRLQAAQCDIVWLGTQRGIEARLVPAARIPIEWISVSGVRGKGAVTLLAAPFWILLAFWQALRALRRHRPAAVVGLGGFVAGPGGVAAWLLRRPLIIHEQNAVAGLTNRLLARLARRVLEAFPGSFGRGRRNATAIGNPVRREFFAQSSPTQRNPRLGERLRLLVIGGSQGARRLNSVIPQAVKLLAQQGQRVALRHQAGPRWLEETRAAYASTGVEAEILPFIDDMAAAYANADLVICRAGALTVSELAAVGVASILVPFAAAVDDHQTANAQHLVAANAARLLPEATLTAEQLAHEIATLCNAPQRLQQMACNAQQLARPQATDALAQAVFAAAGLDWSAA
jgi:UDP-N-acetylglucosamine--N-acetylmuramyl-(pentapeptide) pyrophosphoryl-undecaprenol N-acetylglucosamine transferase